MRAKENYLMSSGELLLVAAASGLESFLMFESKNQHSKEQQIQSVFRLMNDGFFVGRGTSIWPSPLLSPVLKSLKCATTVVIAKLMSCEAAPICVYYDDSAESFLRIFPHKQKEDSYEVSIVDLDSIIEDFEAFNFLPAFRGQEVVFGESAIDRNWDDEIHFTEVDGNLLSTFEKFNLSMKAPISKLSVFHTPFAWCLSPSPANGPEYTLYSRYSFTAWLKGETL